MAYLKRHWIELAALCFGAASLLAALTWRWQIQRFSFASAGDDGRELRSAPFTIYTSYLDAEHNLSIDSWFVVMCASLLAMTAGFLIPRDGSRRGLRTKVLAAAGIVTTVQGCFLAFGAQSPFLLLTALLALLEPTEIIAPRTRPRSTHAPADSSNTSAGMT